jgi:hypothetical protein
MEGHVLCYEGTSLEEQFTISFVSKLVYWSDDPVVSNTPSLPRREMHNLCAGLPTDSSS